jgi:hypothetical protein
MLQSLLTGHSLTSSLHLPYHTVQYIYHGVQWSNRTYVAPALSSLLSTCVVFWSHGRRVVECTAVMFSPERMFITLDSSACTSYPSLKRHKWIYGDLVKLRVMMETSYTTSRGTWKNINSKFLLQYVCRLNCHVCEFINWIVVPEIYQYSHVIVVFLTLFLLFIVRIFRQISLNTIGKNCLLGNRMKIAKFLMRTFTTFPFGGIFQATYSPRMVKVIYTVAR